MKGSDMNIRHTVFALFAVALLAGCGGASDDTQAVAAPTPPVAPTPPGTVPASATASIQAFFAFVGSLMASETAAPLSLDGVVPPTSETALPSPVN